MTDTMTEQQLVEKIKKVTDFCVEHRSKWVMQGMADWHKANRYIAFCMMMGKCAVLWKKDEVQGVLFYWPDFAEHIEMKYAENRPQFEWAEPISGDCVFAGDLIGDKESAGNIIGTLLEQFPHLLITPIYTYRKGKLKKLNIRLLQRFAL
jgi:hypothetical protein